MKHKKLLSLLVLLLTAASGAWAKVPTFDQTIFESDAQLGQIYVTEDTEITIADNVTVTIDGGLVTLDIDGKSFDLYVRSAQDGTAEGGAS